MITLNAAQASSDESQRGCMARPHARVCCFSHALTGPAGYLIFAPRPPGTGAGPPPVFVHCSHSITASLHDSSSDYVSPRTQDSCVRSARAFAIRCFPIQRRACAGEGTRHWFLGPRRGGRLLGRDGDRRSRRRALGLANRLRGKRTHGDDQVCRPRTPLTGATWGSMGQSTPHAGTGAPNRPAGGFFGLNGIQRSVPVRIRCTSWVSVLRWRVTLSSSSLRVLGKGVRTTFAVGAQRSPPRRGREQGERYWQNSDADSRTRR